MAVVRPSKVFEQLGRALRSGRLVSIHSNPDNLDACSVGYVDALTDTHVRLRSVTPGGRLVGYEVRPVEDVVKVEQGGEYLERVARLEEAGAVFVEVEAPQGAKADLIRDTVETAMNTRQYATLSMPTWTEDLVGKVLAVTDLRVTLQLVDRFGKVEGVENIPWRDIDSVDYGTEEEQITGFLAD